MRCAGSASCRSTLHRVARSVSIAEARPRLRLQEEDEADALR